MDVDFFQNQVLPLFFKQIDKILHEKAEHIHQLFENGGVE
jgi:hypothetical protein